MHFTSQKKEEEESRASLHRGDQGHHHGMDGDAGRVPAQRARISSAAPGVIRPPPRARARACSIPQPQWWRAAGSLLPRILVQLSGRMDNLWRAYSRRRGSDLHMETAPTTPYGQHHPGHVSRRARAG